MIRWIPTHSGYLELLVNFTQRNLRDQREEGNMRIVESEKGSLALEQVLFIAAVVALSAGLSVFYGNLSDYFSSISFSDAPTNVGGNS